MVFEEARWLLLRRLQKLSCDSEELPSRMILGGVSRDGELTYGLGGLADVFHGTYQNRAVALKHLRAFRMVDASQESVMTRGSRKWPDIFRT